MEDRKHEDEGKMVWKPAKIMSERVTDGHKRRNEQSEYVEVDESAS